MGPRLRPIVAIAVPLIVGAVAMFPNREYKHVSRDLYRSLKNVNEREYSTPVSNVIGNPELFNHSAMYVFEKQHTGTATTISGNQIDYRVVVHFMLDPQNLVRERLFVEFDIEKPEELERKLDGFSLDYSSFESFEEDLRRAGLTMISPGISKKIAREIEEYRQFALPGNGFRYVDFEGFNPARVNRRKNMLDEHFERTLESDERLSDESSRKYLQREAKKRGVDLDSVSVRGSVDLISEILRDRPFASYHSSDPIGFTQFVSSGGNCTDFSFAAARMFNALAETNPQLANTHCLPLIVHRYDLVSGCPALQGHVVNAIFQTDKKEFAFVDFSGQSNVRNLRTIVWR